VWMAKDLLDERIENTLHVYMKVYRSEWHSFYYNVSRVVDFDMSR